MHELLLNVVAKSTFHFFLLVCCVVQATAVFDVGGAGNAHLIEPCGRCSAADEDAVSNWANFSAWNETTSFDRFFAPVPCNSSISVRGGRLHAAEFALTLMEVRIRELGYRDFDPFPRPANLTAKPSTICMLCENGNFEVDTSDDAFVELNRPGYAVDRIETEGNGDDEKADGAKSPVEPSTSLLISFVDDHFVRDWGSLERVFERPEEMEPITGLDVAHWPFMSTVRPHGVRAGRLWFYFKRGGIGPLFRAESQDDGLTWGPPELVVMKGSDHRCNQSHGVSANKNPRRNELGEPAYLMASQCWAQLYPEYDNGKKWKGLAGTQLHSAGVFGSDDGLNFTLIANPAISEWAKHDFQVADSTNDIDWCPPCQAHVLSSRYAPQDPKKWRHIRGMGYWRAATVSLGSPLFDLDTTIKLDKAGPLEHRLRAIYGTSGSWVDGIYHGTALVHEIPDENKFWRNSPSQRMVCYFFTSRDMRNFTLTSVYARQPILGYTADMYSSLCSNALVVANERWGLMTAVLPMSHQEIAHAQPASQKETAMAWWKPHRMAGLRSAAKRSYRSCYSFLTTKWIRLDSDLKQKLPAEPSPLTFRINCKCVANSEMEVVVRARDIQQQSSANAANERILATSRPIQGDLLRAPVHWEEIQSGTPHVMVDFSREQFSLSFKIKGDCTIYSVWFDL